MEGTPNYSKEMQEIEQIKEESSLKEQAEEGLFEDEPLEDWLEKVSCRDEDDGNDIPAFLDNSLNWPSGQDATFSNGFLHEVDLLSWFYSESTINTALNNNIHEGQWQSQTSSDISTLTTDQNPLMSHQAAISPAGYRLCMMNEAMEEPQTKSALSFEPSSILFKMKFDTHEECVNVLASVLKIHSLGLVQIKRQLSGLNLSGTVYQCAFHEGVCGTNLSIPYVFSCPWMISIIQTKQLFWRIRRSNPTVGHNHPLQQQPYVRPPSMSYEIDNIWRCDPYAEFMVAQEALDNDLYVTASHPTAPRSMSPTWTQLLQDPAGMVWNSVRQALSDDVVGTCLDFALKIFPIQDIFPLGPFRTLLGAEIAIRRWCHDRGYDIKRSSRYDGDEHSVYTTFTCMQSTCLWHVRLCKVTQDDRYIVGLARLKHNHASQLR
ncbi:hypothetical protein AC1031_019899 [Aphanomyces cochlioides]|nr:hypothetical protein AC1031_019899 [Aphanomyces cochlioides]